MRFDAGGHEGVRGHEGQQQKRLAGGGVALRLGAALR